MMPTSSHHIYFVQDVLFSATEYDKFRNVHVWHTIIGKVPNNFLFEIENSKCG